ncbi:hypothetical protein HGRIS_011147 [Hohenbuehelia grisea]|uniref:Uncharacterized protein n=1 Tax=Hohenbuehelia grisea TaxID=104357 RepID=A0ABR3IYZ8_9AGAR
MPSDSQSKPPTQKSTSERPPKRPLSEARAQGRKRTPVPAAWVESVKRSDAEHKSRSEARAQGRKRAPFPEGWAESDKPSNMETQSRSEARTQGKKRAPLPEAWSQNVKRLKSEHSTTSTGFPVSAMRYTSILSVLTEQINTYGHPEKRKTQPGNWSCILN